jgi:choline dehydrogenase-like flavoprotein
MSDRFDVVVIGSGPAGTHASYPLVQAGLRVAMVDGGNQSVEPAGGQPVSFEEARRTHTDQPHSFLGEDFSGIPLDAMGSGTRGSIVSGRRSYVVAGTDALLPVRLDGVRVLQTLARGGLGAVWGGVCAYYAREELEAMGLPAVEMQRHYDVITERIGVSGPQTRHGIQPPFRVDHHAELLLDAFERRRRVFSRLELELAQPHSAVLTRDLAGRRSAAYHDMEYWSDTRRTIYRPQFTLEELERHENFSYFGGRLVERVEERADECRVHSRPVFEASGGPSVLTGRRVIVAAGAVGSARILLRSLELYDRQIPFLGKPHWLTACLHPRTLGKAGRKERLSLCQLLLLDAKHRSPEDYFTAGYAQLYSYKSLGLIRMLGFVPASGPEALGLLALIAPSLVIADMRFPVLRRASRFMKLCREGATEWLHIEAQPEADEFRASSESLARLTSGLRKLGLLPLKRKELPHGAAAHYGGTIPFAPDSASEVLSVDENGRLRQAERIYVADSSTFRFLPAKSINMTIMANANRIGERVRDSLKVDVH